MTTTIRDARPADAPAIAAIYNEGIADRDATLETEPRDAAERTTWLAARSPRHPVVVALDATGQTVGWASLNPFNARESYRHVADISVYVRRANRGQGIGTRLLEELESRARTIGFHKLALAALARNVAGRHLYDRGGFRLIGTYVEQGIVDGQWVDVIVMEKLLI